MDACVIIRFDWLLKEALCEQPPISMVMNGRLKPGKLIKLTEHIENET